MPRTRACLLAGAGIFVLFLLLYGGFTWVTANAVSEQVVASRELLQAQELECPPGAEEANEPWSKGGWMRYCQANEVDHGPWLTARAGRLAIRGEYSEGQKTGVWEWYGEEGDVIRREVYEGAAGEAPQ